MAPMFFGFLGMGVGVGINTQTQKKIKMRVQHPHPHPKPEKNRVQLYGHIIASIYNKDLIILVHNLKITIRFNFIWLYLVYLITQNNYKIY